ncbi:MAG: GIY-YIG nuclease family protein [Hyphomicrobium sp.]
MYILASRQNGTLYVGVTSDVVGRVSEHKQDLLPGFTKRHSVHRLAHVETFDTMDEAIAREKRLKKFSRSAKISLIEKGNPGWCELYWQLSGLIDVDVENQTS